MQDMIRYSVVTNKNKREIVLLKGNRCIWGRCAFCDYIEDNEEDEQKTIAFNKTILDHVTGEYKALEVINSGSVFELPKATLALIRKIVLEKKIKTVFFESYWSYRNRLEEIRDYFGKDVSIVFKCGIETFDETFRNKVLKKGVFFQNPQEVADYFDSICLMVGILGQTKEMIKKDIAILLQYFKRGCVNIYVNNSTAIKADTDLITWFHKEYGFLDENPTVEVLWNNTDFGVGGFANE